MASLLLLLYRKDAEEDSNLRKIMRADECRRALQRASDGIGRAGLEDVIVHPSLKLYASRASQFEIPQLSEMDMVHPVDRLEQAAQLLMREASLCRETRGELPQQNKQSTVHSEEGHNRAHLELSLPNRSFLAMYYKHFAPEAGVGPELLSRTSLKRAFAYVANGDLNVSQVPRPSMLPSRWMALRRLGQTNVSLCALKHKAERWQALHKRRPVLGLKAVAKWLLRVLDAFTDQVLMLYEDPAVTPLQLTVRMRPFCSKVVSMHRLVADMADAEDADFFRKLSSIPLSDAEAATANEMLHAFVIPYIEGTYAEIVRGCEEAMQQAGLVFGDAVSRLSHCISSFQVLELLDPSHALFREKPEETFPAERGPPDVVERLQTVCTRFLTSVFQSCTISDDKLLLRKTDLESRFQKLDPCCSWRLLLEVFAVDGAQLLSDMVQPELLRLFWSRLALSTTLSAIRKYVGFISTLHGLHLRRTERAQMFFAAGHRRFTAHLRAGINWRQTSERG